MTNGAPCVSATWQPTTPKAASPRALDQITPLRRGRDREAVFSHPGRGAVNAHPVDLDLEKLGRGHGVAAGVDELTQRERRAVNAEHAVGPGVVERAFLDHYRGTALFTDAGPPRPAEK
jgi:hypothetical protein